jgi:hypothetical protein
MYACPIPIGFREICISLYSSKTIDKNEILNAFTNIGFYCSDDEIGTASLMQHTFVNINALGYSGELLVCTVKQRYLANRLA